MVDGDGAGEQRLDCCREVRRGRLGSTEGRREIPSSIPRPDLRTGTREMVRGQMVVVVYWYPRWVLLYGRQIGST